MTSENTQLIAFCAWANGWSMQ